MTKSEWTLSSRSTCSPRIHSANAESFTRSDSRRRSPSPSATVATVAPPPRVAGAVSTPTVSWPEPATSRTTWIPADSSATIRTRNGDAWPRSVKRLEMMSHPPVGVRTRQERAARMDGRENVVPARVDQSQVPAGMEQALSVPERLEQVSLDAPLNPGGSPLLGITEERVENAARVALRRSDLQRLGDRAPLHVIEVPTEDAAVAATHELLDELAACGDRRHLGEQPFEIVLVVGGLESKTGGERLQVFDHMLWRERLGGGVVRSRRPEAACDQRRRDAIEPASDANRCRGAPARFPPAEIVAGELQRAEDARPTDAEQMDGVAAEPLPDAAHLRGSRVGDRQVLLAAHVLAHEEHSCRRGADPGLGHELAAHGNPDRLSVEDHPAHAGAEKAGDPPFLVDVHE